MKYNVHLITFLTVGLLASRIMQAAPAGDETQAGIDAREREAADRLQKLQAMETHILH